MILSGDYIRQKVLRGHIRIDPFDPARLSTNSYDLSLFDKLCFYKNEILDPCSPMDIDEKHINAEGIVLEPSTFCLGASVEMIGSDYYVPIIHARSSIARLGLFVHCTADLIDLGSYGRVTFQLYATQKVRLLPGILIGQVSFWAIRGPRVLYCGKYQNSLGPVPSMAYKD